MDEQERLRRKIARLGEEVPLTPTGARRLWAEPDKPLADMLLREIGETVLPRLLTVEDEDGSELARIAAAGRRILSLQMGQVTVSGTDFADDEEFAVALAAALRAALGERSRAGLRTDPTADPAVGAGLRCSVTAVAAALARQMGGASGLRRYAESLGGQALAWRVIDGGEIVAEGGDIARLPDAAPAVVVARLDAALGQDDPDGIVLLERCDDATGLILARSGPALLMALTAERAAATDPIQIWQRLVGARPARP